MEGKTTECAFGYTRCIPLPRMSYKAEFEGQPRVLTLKPRMLYKGTDDKQAMDRTFA
jgi:hypothetical protein